MDKETIISMLLVFAFVLGSVFGYVVPPTPLPNHIKVTYIEGHFCVPAEDLFQQPFDFEGEFVKHDTLCYDIMNYTSIYKMKGVSKCTVT